MISENMNKKEEVIQKKESKENKENKENNNSENKLNNKPSEQIELSNEILNEIFKELDSENN